MTRPLPPMEGMETPEQRGQREHEKMMEEIRAQGTARAAGKVAATPPPKHGFVERARDTIRKLYGLHDTLTLNSAAGRDLNKTTDPLRDKFREELGPPETPRPPIEPEPKPPEESKAGLHECGKFESSSSERRWGMTRQKWLMILGGIVLLWINLVGFALLWHSLTSRYEYLHAVGRFVYRLDRFSGEILMAEGEEAWPVRIYHDRSERDAVRAAEQAKPPVPAE